MSSTPTLNGQIIGQAHYATRAVLERFLTSTGTTFHQSVVLNVVADNDGAVDRDRVVDRVTSALKIDESAARAAIDELTAAQLLESGDGVRVRLTETGKERHREIRTAVGGITARLYADLPAEDLATAGRVLTVVTTRADAELAN